MANGNQAFGDFGFSNPFQEFLEENPRAAFYAQGDPFGGDRTGGPREKQVFQNQFQNIYNQYMGTLGQQVQRGEVPSLRFQDYLKDFSFSQHFRSLPPSMRGASTGAYAPQARFLF